MNKSDLKDGYVVDLRCGLRRVVLFEQLLIDYDDIYEVGSDLTEKYRENLTHRSDDNLDIVKIYDNDMDLLWERGKEVDWSKVPIGTKILFSSDGKKYTEGLFIKKDCDKFIICDDIENRLFSTWNYCKLAEKPKEEVTYNDMIDEFTKYCDTYSYARGTCTSCYYEGNNGRCNMSKFMDERFTIMRK